MKNKLKVMIKIKMKTSIALILGILVALTDVVLSAENKYSKEANVINYRELEKPFRMAKINLVWQKALQKLTETKLRSLYTDLQLQDKEEIQLKRLKAEGGDKEGLKEATLRRKFKGLLNSFGLIEYFEEGATPEKEHKSYRNSDNHINKSLFKDKKLNKLWEKAEKGGFTQQELKTLKEEFSHHQDKIDEYYNLLETVSKSDKNDMNNEVYHDLSLLEDSDNLIPSQKKSNTSLNELRQKHRDIKDGYDVLHKKAASGPSSIDFTEPRVQNLWKIALNADFTPDELSSLQLELKHYEKRIEKLHMLQGELLVKSDYVKDANTNKDVTSFFEDKIKRHERQVEKLHNELETRILNRHNEL
ncbi:unnamed protein product [Allacma fusca]|uniref:Alpha-2-macroglobulin receptor-associated protein n=1 Tax=Allacma fusca TaxID=39272 RepID=A0A8J2J4V3_9HEXA|nr:unnamed protein product [Allacma fusca]